MGLQDTRLFQVSDALSSVRLPPVPRDGWLAAVRQALGMSATAAAATAGITPQSWLAAEAREKSKTVTLATLSELAGALECDVAYVLVPRRPLRKIVEGRAGEIAVQETEASRKTMALEGQEPDARALRRSAKMRQAELLAGNWTSTLWQR